MNTTNKLLSSSLSWIRKSLSEPEPVAITRKETRSQSMVHHHTKTTNSFWGGQRSLDGDPHLKLPDPFDIEEEEVTLDGTSQILLDEDVNFLSQQLPARLVGSVWHLLFSTESHGFSLSTVYRVVKEKDPECKIPVLLLIRDTSNHRFGAFLSQGPKLCEKSFGCGETFVFSLTSEKTCENNDDDDDGNTCRKIFKWNGDPKKNLFIVCSSDCLSVGIDDGKFAIYLDSALNQGRSQSCLTFNNDPLTPNEDFIASQVEMWTFR